VLLAAVPARAAEPRLHILATFAPIYSFVSTIAGSAAEVEMLLPANASPHDFALAPGDLGKIARADVVVCNGLGLEGWLEKALSNAGRNNVLRIDASKAIPRENLPQSDPHVWLNPLHAIEQVKTICAALSKRDPQNAELYHRNADRYIERLQSLDAAISNATRKMPNKSIVTLHNSFSEFAHRYGFDVAGTIEDSPGREPTPKELRNLRRVIQQKNVAVIFSEPDSGSPQLARLVEDLHVRVAVLDPIETGAPSSDLYERVMKKNLEVLQRELRGDK
jgi:zinc transport system substrate-binding protein